MLRLSITLQLFIIVVLVTTIPLQIWRILTPNSRFMPFNAFEISIATFAICLFCFHCYFWRLKRISNFRTVRLIDYVYLSVASIGLLAAADVDQRIYRFDMQNYVYITRSALSFAGEIAQQEFSKCSPDRDHDRCEALRKLPLLASRLRDGLHEQSDDPETAKRALNRFYSEAGAAPDIAKASKENLRMNGFDLDKDGAMLARKPFDPDQYPFFFGPMTTVDTLRQLGFALLAAALALRITRVSIEMFGWQRSC